MANCINLNNLSECCGCAACADVCSLEAIAMVAGADGARYPRVDTEKCVNCGLCHKVCPIQNCPPPPFFEKHAYVAYLKDTAEREKSASGGAFMGIVNALCEENPSLYIAGAAWLSPTEVGHRCLSAKEAKVFRKSKYVQSKADGIYQAIKDKLEDGKIVLFTGTPCQVAALRNFLKKEYESLYTADLICHGVPGGEVFKAYTDEIKARYHSAVKSVTFRYKKGDLLGELRSDHLRIELENGRVLVRNKKTDPYLRGYHSGLYFRESCYACPYANPNRVGDLTLGDYWSIQKLYPELIDGTGISSILVNTERGAQLLKKCTALTLRETEVDFLLRHNENLVHPFVMHRQRKLFFERFGTETFSTSVLATIGKPKKLKYFISRSIPEKLRRGIARVLKRRG